MSRRFVPCLALLAVLVALVATLAAPALAKPEPTTASPRDAAVDRCRRDLATRLKVDLTKVTLVNASAEQFPDTSLGLPRPGEMAAQVITPGWRVVLDSPKGRYFYCVSSGAPRYGGKVDARRPHVVK